MSKTFHHWNSSSSKRLRYNHTNNNNNSFVFVLLVVLVIVWFPEVSFSKRNNSIFSTIQKKVLQKSPFMGNIVRMVKYDRAANVANAITSLQLLNHDLKWHRLDDGVMGGRSETILTTTTLSSSVLHFQGTINTNGGGFTSIRAPLPSSIFSDNVISLRIRLKGDGKTYKVLLSDGNGLRSPSWQIDLPTSSNSKGTVVELPLNQFQPSFGPRKVSESDLHKYKLIPSEMKELGFMLSLKLSDGTSNPEETFGKDIFDFSLIIESIEPIFDETK